MNATKTIRGKCPRCCPDGGACFELYGCNEKRCLNCHLVLPFRRIRCTGKPTISQQNIIGRVVAMFGGQAKITMIGRKVFLNVSNADRNWILGDSLFGTIGPRGSFKITLQRVGGDIVLNNDIDLSVYLK